MASLILLEIPRNFPSFPTIFLAISQDRELFNTLKSLMPRFMHMGRDSPHPLASLLFIPIDAPKPHIVLNAKNSVTSAKIAATISVEDAFGGDQDILPLTAKLKIIVGEKK
jgi:hypothetical protein